MPPGTTFPVQSSTDGARLTVNQMVGAPTFIPERVVTDIKDQFLIESVFRQGPPASTGTVGFEESAPMYADGEPEVIAEGGEIPLVGTSRGLSRVLSTTKRGFGLQITRETRDRNDTGEVQKRMRMLRNTLTRAWDRLFQDVILNHPGVHSMAAAQPWYSNAFEPSGSQSTGRSIRYDITQAETLIVDSTPDEENRPEDFFGFEPDVLIIPRSCAAGFKDNDAVNEVFAHGVLADEQIRYTGVMPRRFYGQNVLISRTLPPDVAVLLERGTSGFISDERRLQGTPMEYKSRTEVWESYFTRRSVAGLDQPKSVTIISGIRGA